jgi:hypothetical protein
MSTKDLQWPVPGRCLFSDHPVCIPLYIGRAEKIEFWPPLHSVEKPGSWPPPPALPANEFQHPFRCYNCGYWLRNFEYLWEHATNITVCNNLTLDILRYRQEGYFCYSAREQLANIAQFYTLNMFPSGYPVRCPHCRNFFVNHLCLSEHVFLVHANHTEPKSIHTVPISMSLYYADSDERCHPPEFSNACTCGGVSSWLNKDKGRRPGNLPWHSTVRLAKWAAMAEMSMIRKGLMPAGSVSTSIFSPLWRPLQM